MFTIKQLEIWKPIKDYEGFYEISNFGNVKSLARITNHYCGGEKILKTKSKSSAGYNLASLYKNGGGKTFSIHQLVWDHFGDTLREGLQIDHIDNDKTNNYIANLQLLSQRENVSKKCKEKPKSSVHTGVTWHKKNNKWGTYFSIKEKRYHLGYYVDENEATLMYKQAIGSLGNDSSIIIGRQIPS